MPLYMESFSFYMRTNDVQVYRRIDICLNLMLLLHILLRSY